MPVAAARPWSAMAAQPATQVYSRLVGPRSLGRPRLQPQRHLLQPQRSARRGLSRGHWGVLEVQQRSAGVLVRLGSCPDNSKSLAWAAHLAQLKADSASDRRQDHPLRLAVPSRRPSKTGGAEPVQLQRQLQRLLLRLGTKTQECRPCGQAVCAGRKQHAPAMLAEQQHV